MTATQPGRFPRLRPSGSPSPKSPVPRNPKYKTQITKHELQNQNYKTTLQHELTTQHYKTKIPNPQLQNHSIKPKLHNQNKHKTKPHIPNQFTKPRYQQITKPEILNPHVQNQITKPQYTPTHPNNNTINNK